MKKTVCLLLAVLLLCAVIPAMAESISMGNWYCVRIDADDGMRSGDPISVGINWVFTLNEDGTCTFVYSEGEFSYTWPISNWTFENGVLTVDDGEMILEGDQLKAHVDDDSWPASLIFSQNPVVVVAAQSEDEFIGTWNLDQGISDGWIVSAADLGMEVTLAVTPGQASLIHNGEGEASPSKLMDGALQFTDTDGTILFAYMNTNGQVSISTKNEDQEMTLYFSKAE